MKKEKREKNRNPHLLQIRNYTLLTILVGIPLLVLLVPYARLIFPQEHVPLSLFFTLLFITGIYSGRYLAGIWTTGQKKITRKLYIILGIAIAISLLVILIQAQSLYMSGSGENAIPLNFFVSSAALTVLATCTGLLIKIIRFSVNIQLTVAKATAAQSLSELHFLQSQLSPHFLFNTLNNLYGISLSQHEKIPSLLLKLSDLLRYSVYDARELFVPLADEISYIKNYIDFEKLRIGDRLELDVTIEQVYSNHIKIAPLLLIVFIENAFKHAKNTITDKVQISIILKTFGKDILFLVKNNYNTDAADNNPLEPHSGFGLDNVNKRLELLYPGKYELSTIQEDGFYSVKLQLKQ